MEKSYKHRDVNWLSFNERVLQEAENPATPLLERLKFLAIFSSNLDEYFRVRISQLRQLKKVDKKLRKKLMTRSNKTLKHILKEVHAQQCRFGEILQNIYRGLEDHGVYFETPQSCSAQQQEFLETFFSNEVMDDCEVLQEFTSEDLQNGKIYLLVAFEDGSFSLVLVPTDKHGRFIELPGERTHYIFLDDVLRCHLDKLFTGKTVKNAYSIKLSRDAELYLEDETSDTDLVERIYSSLDQRTSGQPTRLLYDESMPKKLCGSLMKELEISKIDMFPGGRYHNFSDFMDFSLSLEKPGLKYEEMPPLPHPELAGIKDYFAALKQKDYLTHYPYQDFSVLENFIRQASDDDKVTSLKISLYRIAKESTLTDALLKALKNGKEVIVFVEAKARFDEENNIFWGKTLEENGAKVIFSVPNIKVHAKIAMVEREEEGGLMRYGYIGTGNFNAQTSKIYCDHGLFTADKRITEDLSQVFLVLEKKLIIPKLKYLLASPYNTRSTFRELIENEIRNRQEGKRALVIAKMNSLEDKGMIDELYKALAQGVDIRLLVRGFCCLVPPTPEEGSSWGKLEITSIIDRYLEHGRIYYFYNDGDPKMYMGSADWMTRNLDKRIEVLTPILSPHIFKELKQVLDIQLADNVKARIIDREDTNTYVERAAGEKPVRSQYSIYEFLKSKLVVNQDI
ncbi:polyphosphate kinase 1 [Zeaxanthinibacter enoshimensis]|uniref:Polyphosphate kinase n=1 Tax=Zeaxanthinibacter enoshimensis TaxID=392009 RepID=A0A4R6TNJ6_9FLAO|nr:polyphosphate kinase 1 [Zeaxanthinibacter enoshimensis]TDQ31339.1 polyphosphate kinase [Zeaxanthinibacter enoshimensis]